MYLHPHNLGFVDWLKNRNLVNYLETHRLLKVLWICIPAIVPYFCLGQEGVTLEVPVDSVVSAGLKNWNIQVCYVIGYKQLEEEWSPANGQFEFGVFEIDYYRRKWPVNLVCRLLLSYSSEIPNLPGFIGSFSGTYEVDIGVRKKIRYSEKIQPFVSGGFGVLGASTTSHFKDYGYVQEANESAIGFWLETGTFYLFSRHWVAGISFEYSYTNISLFNNTVNPGGLHMLILFGYR